MYGSVAYYICYLFQNSKIIIWRADSASIIFLPTKITDSRQIDHGVYIYGHWSLVIGQ